MDPDATLAKIRDIITELHTNDGHTTHLHLAYLVGQLVGHMDALDRWLSQGGFPPAAWSTETIDG